MLSILDDDVSISKGSYHSTMLPTVHFQILCSMGGARMTTQINMKCDVEKIPLTQMMDSHSLK